MRIISKFHDYYDCIQSLGQDKTCTWIRDIRKKESCHSKYKYKAYNSGNRYPLIESYIIGFCGKLYPLLLFTDESCKRHYCYSPEDVERFAQTLSKKEYKNYKQSDHLLFGKNYSHFREKETLNFFTNFEYHSKSYESVFVKQKCPIFIIDSINGDAVYHGIIDKTDLNKVECDDDYTLSKFEFYRIVDPYTAFQEIHQYIGGILGFNNPVVPVPDDITMRDIKGFNDKSFKKDKAG